MSCLSRRALPGPAVAPFAWKFKPRLESRDGHDWSSPQTVAERFFIESETRSGGTAGRLPHERADAGTFIPDAACGIPSVSGHRAIHTRRRCPRVEASARLVRWTAAHELRAECGPDRSAR